MVKSIMMVDDFEILKEISDDMLKLLRESGYLYYDYRHVLDGIVE